MGCRVNINSIRNFLIMTYVILFIVSTRGKYLCGQKREKNANIVFECPLNQLISMPNLYTYFYSLFTIDNSLIKGLYILG